jgi:hypothetical protein
MIAEMRTGNPDGAIHTSPRRGRAALALLSFVALVVVLVLWARSYLPEQLHVATVDGRLILLFADDGLTSYWSRIEHGQEVTPRPVPTAELWRKVQRGQFINRLTYSPPPGPNMPQVLLNPPPTVTRRLGVVWATEVRGGTPAPYRLLAIPFGYLAVALAIGPLAWLVGRARNRLRRRPGHCRQCGYDLRGSPGRCPECGAAAAAAPPVPAPASTELAEVPAVDRVDPSGSRGGVRAVKTVE